MKAALLIEIGEALFGPQWIRPMARALEVNERTVQRWAAKQNDPPEGLPDDLAGLLADRTERFGKLLKKLQAGT